MTACSFEKDANAEILFDKAEVSYTGDEQIVMLHHKRIKIFNDKGIDAASVRIVYFGAHKDEVISDVEAETINLTQNKIEYTIIDPKLIYTQNIDKDKKAIAFTFPNVKAGSVIEFKYRWKTSYPTNHPDWIFQSLIPTRYSEFQGNIIQISQLEL